MSKTADVISGQPILAPWGNEVRDRTIQVFASVAERDGAFPTPPAGMMCYINSNDITEGLYSYHGGAWRPGSWNNAWGLVLPPAVWSATSESAIAEIILGNSSLNFFAVANRWYKLTAQLVGIINIGSGTQTQLHWRRHPSDIPQLSGSTILASTRFGGNNQVPMTLITYQTFSTGNRNVFVSCGGDFSGGFSIGSSSTQYANVYSIEDAGPAGVPS